MRVLLGKKQMKTYNARQIQKEKILGLDTNLQRQILVNSKGLEFLHSKWILISLMTGQELQTRY